MTALRQSPASGIWCLYCGKPEEGAVNASPTLGQLAAAVVAVMNAVPYVQKTGEMKDGPRYHYAGEGDFIERLHPAMVAHGLSLVPLRCEMRYAEHSATKSGTAQWRAEVTQAWLLLHISGEFLELQTCGVGIDAGDKAAGKAATQALKWALRQTFNVETGVDPDTTSSSSQESLSKAELIQMWKEWSPSPETNEALDALELSANDVRRVGVVLRRPPPGVPDEGQLVQWIRDHSGEVRSILNARSS